MSTVDEAKTSVGGRGGRVQRGINAGLGSEQTERVDVVDFKMVTFSLGGKDYGIDIMKVKEIAKFTSFTYVPNTPSFVSGVYNLRGDIISILDLRKMFHLPIPDQKKEVQDGLILRLDQNLIGIIVDSIDKVVGISSKTIQPPHPIFGDINIKFISGVVENDGRLYIILDTERIFGKESHAEPESGPGESVDMEAPAPAAGQEPAAAVVSGQGADRDVGPASTNLHFIYDTLATFADFHASPINERWVADRFQDWQASRGAANSQITQKSDADEFLSPFYSPFTGRFWSDEYAARITEVLPTVEGPLLNVLNPGCGKGYETYSLAALLQKTYPDKRIRIWAEDKDLLAISNAPNLVFSAEQIPSYLEPYVVEGKNGTSVKQDVKEQILFEYHDVVNGTNSPDVDIVVARDILSFLTVENQERMLAEITEKLKSGGIVIVGHNESLNTDRWLPIESASLSAYKKA